MTTINPQKNDYVTGDVTGLGFPAHSEALIWAGEDFLTEAFRTFGSLSPENRVSRIVKVEPCSGGSTGDKLFLAVEYEHAECGLHTDLFVKFSRDFEDPVRDRGRHEMESEARFAAISRLPGFPISVPEALFADFHHESGTGLIISQRIAFGEDGIQPHLRKCLDHQLDDALPYYRAIITALARLAAAHKSGQLASDIDELFTYDAASASSDPILYSEEELRTVLANCADFAEQCPQLLPPEIRSPEFLAELERGALRIRENESMIQRFLRGNSDLIALCHWNAHIDNAWFWHDGTGELQCGLMDWGRVNQITMGAALWGCLSAAHHDIWEHHLDALLALFVLEYHAHGGPKIAVEELELHLKLHVASMGVSRVLAFPATVLFRLPEAAAASGSRDPIFLRSDPARNCLHIFTVFLNLWRKRDLGTSLDKLLKRLGEAAL